MDEIARNLKNKEAITRENAKRMEPPPARPGGCEVCGQYPYFSDSGMCGPCTFGTADALGEGDVFGPEDE